MKAKDPSDCIPNLMEELDKIERSLDRKPYICKTQVDKRNWLTKLK